MKFDCTKKIGVLSCTKPIFFLKLIHHTLLCDKKNTFPYLEAASAAKKTLQLNYILCKKKSLRFFHFSQMKSTWMKQTSTYIKFRSLMYFTMLPEQKS